MIKKADRQVKANGAVAADVVLAIGKSTRAVLTAIGGSGKEGDSKFGLVTDYWIVSVVASSKVPITTRKLVRQLGLSKSVIEFGLQGLIERGLITASGELADAATSFSVTAAAQEQLPGLRESADKALLEVMTASGPAMEDLQLVMKVVKILSRALQS